MNTLQYRPDTGIFRSTLLIILIVILIGIFFRYSEKLNKRVEEVATGQVIVEIRQALSMMLYDYAVKGKLRDLQNFDRDNPFIPLATYRSLPGNYHGAINNENEMLAMGWYFNLSSGRVIYKFKDQSIPNLEYVMVFEYEDLNSDGVFGNSEVGYLKIVEG